MLRRHRTLALAGSLAGIALLAGACSGGSSPGTTAGDTGAAEAASTASTSGAAPVQLEGEVNDHGTATVSGGQVELELDDFYFDPTYLQADPGATVEVELSNEGSASHTFTIDDQNIDVEVAPGSHETVEVTIPDSGSVRFYCRFHVGQGMQGAFFTAAG